MKKTLIKVLVAFISILFIANMAFAVVETCESNAASKKLVGEAKNSFIKKCEADAKTAKAQASREANAKEKNMAGITKISLLKILFSLHKMNFDG